MPVPPAMLRRLIRAMTCASHLLFVQLVFVTSASALESEGELLPDQEPEHAWTLTVENDIFAGKDGGYTNGLGFSVAHGPYDSFSEQLLPDWMVNLVSKTYIAKLPDRQRAVAYTFSQSMHTPRDISVSELQVDEPPYAGLLAGRINLYAIDRVSSDQLSLTVGVVGELALAAPSQRIIHRITGSEEPQGWDNQLENEVVFMLEASHAQRVLASSADRDLESDLIMIGGARLGTLQSSASISALFRIGNLLELSHATASMLPERQVSMLAFVNDSAWYAFVGAEASAVANDIFINGNTYTDSHSLPLDHSRSLLSAGVSWNMGTFAFTLSYAETKGGGETDPFGSFSITSKY